MLYQTDFREYSAQSGSSILALTSKRHQDRKLDSQATADPDADGAKCAADTMLGLTHTIYAVVPFIAHVPLTPAAIRPWTFVPYCPD